MKVAVLKGGTALERGTALRSAARVEEALGRLGHDATSVEAGPDLVRRLAGERPDVAFVALRGGGGDGAIQELLEILGVPHTGSSAAACARCADRVVAKRELRLAGVATPDWLALEEAAFRELGAAEALGDVEERLGFPMVVKPSRGAAPIGPGVAASWFEAPAALVSAFEFDERVMLERVAQGRELSVALLGGRVLGDADGAVGRVAVAAYEALGCAGPAVVEVVLSDDGPQVIELDPIPALDRGAPLPGAAEEAGMSFEALIEAILAAA